MTAETQSSPPPARASQPAATLPDPAAPLRDRLLKGLTSEQAQAVMHGCGPMLVLASAGSGKTTVITRRIAMLLARGVKPWHILALTFTNKAAGEMRERVARVLGEDALNSSGLTVTTFHSFCARVLRRYADRCGLNPDYTIYDSADQKSAMKSALERLNISTQHVTPDAVLGVISGAKNQLVGPDEFRHYARDYFDSQVAKAYPAYAKALKDANAVDFDDLLFFVARLLRDDEAVRDEMRQRHRHMLIDEYQDTNHAQFVIARALADGTRNICVVGDPDQSIYGWRGADIRNILEFNQHYPEAVVVKLGENFRSTAPILRIADHLIKHNRKRKEKPLYTTKEGGSKAILCTCWDHDDEAARVANFLAEMEKTGREKEGGGGLPWKQMAIFYRTNALSRTLESALREREIPYTIARGTAFYDRKEIKDALAYLRLIVNPQDEVSLQRIVNTPPRGIGDTTMEKVEAFARANSIGLFDALLRSREVPDLSARATAALEKFARMVQAWIRDVQNGGAAGSFMGAVVRVELRELVMRVLKESGLAEHFRKSGTDEDRERLENLDELVNAAAEFDAQGGLAADGDDSATGEDSPPRDDDTLTTRLRAYLESVALVSDADSIDPERGAVTLMTLHTAKGLEFDAVAIVGLEEGLLPHSMSREEDDNAEEERRLFFVGITRARKHLLITTTRSRLVHGRTEDRIPSRFLSELPEDDIERVGAVSEFAGTRNWGGSPEEQRAGQWGRRASRERSEFDDPESASWGRPASGATQSLPWSRGQRVAHPQFGRGTVHNVSRLGQHTRVQINFDHVGMKTLIAEYARLEKA